MALNPAPSYKRLNAISTAFLPISRSSSTRGGAKLEITNCDFDCGARRATPYAFTEQGVAMLSSVLRSDRAIRVNIEIMRAFVRLRRMALSQAHLARRLDALEGKYDARFKDVFDAIRQLMAPPTPPRPKIGFGAWTRRRLQEPRLCAQRRSAICPRAGKPRKSATCLPCNREKPCRRSRAGPVTDSVSADGQRLLGASGHCQRRSHAVQRRGNCAPLAATRRPPRM